MPVSSAATNTPVSGRREPVDREPLRLSLAVATTTRHALHQVMQMRHLPTGHESVPLNVEPSSVV